MRNVLAPNTWRVWPWIEMYQRWKQRRNWRSLLPWNESSQKGKPIAFYSRNINSAQQNYTTTEK